MTTEESKDLIHRVFSLAGSGDLSEFETLLDDNFTYRSTVGEEVHGRDAMIDFVTMFNEAFSNFRVEPQDLVAEGDTVYFTYRQTGTHTGEYWGIAPSNEEMDILITARVKVRNGKLVEQFDNYNALELLRQLNAFPEASRRDVDKISRQIPRTRA